MADKRMTVDFDGNSIKKYGKYGLYKMTVEYDTTLINDVIKHFTNLREICKQGGIAVDAAANTAVKQALRVKTDKSIDFNSFGCTAFSAKDINNIVYMGRNYDFVTNASCMCIQTILKPGNGEKTQYNSIAFATVSSLDTDAPTNCTEEELMLLPFACLDGINEVGVSIAVLVVDTKADVGATYQYRDGDNIFTTLAIRCVLDYASSTQEAVDLLKKYNMFATGTKDYHFFINDAQGDSRVVEYNYKKETRELTDKDIQAATNFYVIDKETFGHGHERYQTVMNVVKEEQVTKDKLWKALKDVAQEAEEGNVTSNTQWSILFNNTELSAEIALFRKFEEKSKFNMISKIN